MDDDALPTPSDTQDAQRQPERGAVDTGGGAYVAGDVQVVGGDFVGRDQNIFTEEAAYNVAGLPNPYLGLRAFTYDDRAAYAGRQREIEEAVEKLTRPGEQRTLLFVTGASGSGKSSLAQAGLLPALERHYAQRNLPVYKAVFHPSQHPMAMLGDALMQLGASGLDAFERLPGLKILILDQFEEVFTQSDAAERDGLFKWLMELPPFQACRTHVIATLRSDYLGELYEVRPLWEVAKEGVELRAMGLDPLREAIQAPLWARYPHGEKRFEPALVDRLAQDASASPTLLPLLQVTLEETWKKGRLVLANYRVLTDAIKQRADQVYEFRDYDSASPNQPRSRAEQEAVSALFLDLVNVSLDDDDRRDVRISRSTDSLKPERRRLVNDLVAARLLSTSVVSTVETVSIIHESLISNWVRLRDAVAEQREFLQQRARFEQQLKDWLANHKSDDYLLRDVYLAQARRLESDGDVALQNAGAREFFQRSVERTEAEQRQELVEQKRRTRRFRIIAAALGVALLIAVGATGVAVTSQQAMRQQRDLARSRELAALALSQLAQGEDYERVLLLALEAVKVAPTLEAQNALRQSLLLPRVRANVAGRPAPVSVGICKLVPPPTPSGDEYSPDGESILRVNYDWAQLVDAQTLEAIDLEIRDGRIMLAEFTPRGNQVVIAGTGGDVNIYDVPSGRRAARLRADSRAVYDVQFSPKGNRLLTIGLGSSRLWDPESATEVARLTERDNEVCRFQFSEDGQWIATEDGRTVQVWDGWTGKRVSVWEGYDAAFSPDELWIAIAGNDGLVRVRDVETGDEQFRVNGSHPVFSADGEWITTTLKDNTVRTWYAESDPALDEIMARTGSNASAAVLSDLINYAESRLTRPLTCDERRELLGEPLACPTPIVEP